MCNITQIRMIFHRIRGSLHRIRGSFHWMRRNSHRIRRSFHRMRGNSQRVRWNSHRTQGNSPRNAGFCVGFEPTEESSEAHKHTRCAKPRAASSEGAPHSDFPRAAPVASSTARFRAPARGARAPRRRASGAKEQRMRGATDGTRAEDNEERTTAAAAALDVPAELRRREPPAMCARRARRARADPSVHPRTVPSLRTERRPKRRRETKTTTSDRTREEDEDHRGA